MVQLSSIVPIAAATLALCFLSAMLVSILIVFKTGDTKGLRDLAEVVRAFFSRGTK